MHEHLAQLEHYTDLEGSIIKTTKINKVLKAMIKLATIPRDEEFEFKKRSQSVLSKWSKALSEETTATTNGVAHETAKAETEEPAAKSIEPPEAPVETANKVSNETKDDSTHTPLPDSKEELASAPVEATAA